MKDLIQQVKDGRELERAEVMVAGDFLLDEKISVEDKANFLSELASKGETPGEIAAFVETFLQRAVDPGLSSDDLDGPVLDVCGTGGDQLDLFNVSTATIFVLAAAGVKVVKHGNRAITSKSGGADVLEALGIRIDMAPEEFSECVKQVGAGFLFAPMYHPAFKAVAPVRALLAKRGQRTIFNILGPLLNPVRPDYQVIGVFDEKLAPVFADILTRLGRKQAWAVHGKTAQGDGMDELSVCGATQIWKSCEGEKSSLLVEPGDVGLAVSEVEDLKGGDAVENAAILRGILQGEVGGAKRDIVLLNAAAGLVVTGKAADLSEGLALAGEQVDSGAAMGVLEKWRDF
ncbi:MAG: anthranilate phosphoribosyltransferase [Verrucomicrobiales bacterium]|nr:anthranilate phosphoribosyltransferase [Verrucomicrobiales bacterium]